MKVNCLTLDRQGAMELHDFPKPQEGVNDITHPHANPEVCLFSGPHHRSVSSSCGCCCRSSRDEGIDIAGRMVEKEVKR